VDPDFRVSPLAVAVLSLLHAGPLHPYAMQRLIKEWGKDRVINVGQRANLYKTIKRLQDAGLVAVLQTERDQRYPERTVYELTAAGRAAAPAWIAGLVAVPRNEYPQFPAALSFLMLLDPQDAQRALEQRAAALAGSLQEVEASLAELGGTLPRVTLMDDEYERAITTAELAWLTGIIEDLRSGSLTWNEDMFAAVAQFPPDPDADGQSPG
jgi:DNA-binding PadR family transcriptional regulator